jgi:LysM repeat protein
MQLQTIRQNMSKLKVLIPLCFGALVSTGCESSWNPFHKKEHTAAPVPVVQQETTVEGTVVGDNRTAMEAAVDAGPSTPSTQSTADGASPVIAPNAPDTYVVKRGDTLWGIAKVFLRDPWYWPEIWQVNPQVKNPHLIYPGDTLRLVYIDGQPHIQLERGDAARVQPRVRSQPLEDAIRSIPYEIIAAFMSKPSVLSAEDVKKAPYVLAARDHHVVMAEGNTIYARGFRSPAEVGAHYNIVRVGDKLRDPDGGDVIGYDGIFTAAGKVTRAGDPTTLLLTESGRETIAGDKLFSGSIDVPLDFVPSAPKVKVNGRIISVHDGVEMIGQYQVVVVNRGARHGLMPGNVLAIFQAGEAVPDREKSALAHNSTLFAKKVQLPDERTGTFMVFKTFDRISYGLVMEAKGTIHVLDKIQNP